MRWRCRGDNVCAAGVAVPGTVLGRKGYIMDSGFCRIRCMCDGHCPLIGDYLQAHSGEWDYHVSGVCRYVVTGEYSVLQETAALLVIVSSPFVTRGGPDKLSGRIFGFGTIRYPAGYFSLSCRIAGY